MVNMGLKEETETFYEENWENYQKLVTHLGPYAGDARSKGIFQSIGFKELMPFLHLSEEEKKSEKGSEIFRKSIDELKIATRQYARRQNKWVRNRFLRKPDRPVPPVFGLDATDLQKWNENVFAKASKIVENFLVDQKIPFDPCPIEPNEFDSDRNKNFFCNECQSLIAGAKQWQAHLKSKGHQHKVGSLKSLKEIQEEIGPNAGTPIPV